MIAKTFRGGMVDRGELLVGVRPSSLRSVPDLLSRARQIGGWASPRDWRDEVLYFLLPDRFSEGREEARPLLTRDAIRSLRDQPGRNDWSWHDWAESGKRWQGGTLRGIRGRLGYLQCLGVTALWIGPVLKQRPPTPGPPRQPRGVGLGGGRMGDGWSRPYLARCRQHPLLGRTALRS